MAILEVLTLIGLQMEIDLKHLSKIEVAALLGRDTKSIDIYVKQKEDPLPKYEVPSSHPYYIWTEVLEWWIRRHTAKLTKFQPQDELNEAKLVGQNIKNEAEQLELDVRKGMLLEASDVKQVWSDSLVNIRQSLLNVGHTASTEIIDGMKYAKKKAIIDKLIFSNLDKLIEEAKSVEDTNEES